MWGSLTIILMTCISLFFMPISFGTRQNLNIQNQALALEFHEYRSALHNYNCTTPGASGVISLSDFNLPTELNISGHWHNQIVGGIEYVYGNNQEGLWHALLQTTLTNPIPERSRAIGIKQNGHFVCPETGTITIDPLPTFIPDNDIVSVLARN